jgi:N-methylhydantoinase A/oxoprolinase/acetone carboxylase beta subunit
MTERSYAIGLDIGGTFTDLVLLDESGGFTVHKLLTTPDNPALAALQGIEELVASAEVRIDEVELVVHSTTLVTNALIQQRGARTGLITTRGFRDILEMRDEHRYDIYDLFLTWPDPIVPRERRLTVNERITRDGTVLIEPQEAEVAEVTRQLQKDGVEAIAVSFLHSYKNPVNEQKVASMIRSVAPDLPVTLSSDVAPVIREYERTSTAVADAFVRPLANAYLTQMVEGLEQRGFGGRFYLMLSGGGSASLASARQYPIRLAESGPAAGALAAGLYGQLTQNDPIVSFDMGGTTAKLCLLEDGRPAVVNSLEVARTRRFMRGSGMPLVIPSVELIEIGAGGGSIARIDAMGLLKVGPDSAGAEPGPVSYGQGGTEATVTDANLVLGYLDAGYFLGGRMRLDINAARAALGRLGDKADMSPLAAAWGVHQVVNENMAQAARMHLQEKNWDPRKVTMVAFGGAGPAHAATIARLLGTHRLVFPLGAGATSALGCLAAPLSFQFTRSRVSVIEELDWADINALYAEMEERGRAALADAGVPADQVELVREADLRIYGQIHEITMPVMGGELGPRSIPSLRQAFGEAYRRNYSRYSEEALVEAVNWKLTARGPSRRVELRIPSSDGATHAVKGRRPAYLREAGDLVETVVYDRYLLTPGVTLNGPAILEERETTVILPSGSTGTVDEFGNLIVELEGQTPRRGQP